MTIESVVNQALDIIGYKRHIGNIWEGSVAARLALDAWAQSRDMLLTSLQPDWSTKDAVLTLLASAPADGYSPGTPWTVAFPPLPWQYSYEYPADCLVPRQIKPVATTLPIWRPRYHSFRSAQMSSQTVILTDVPDAMLVYTARVLDPDEWHDDFTMAMLQMLAKKFEAGLTGRSPQQEKKQDADDS